MHIYMFFSTETVEFQHTYPQVRRVRYAVAMVKYGPAIEVS